MLSLYSHAYQSYIWNRVITERSRLFGNDKPLVGDIVLVSANKKKDARPNNNVGRRNHNDVSSKMNINQRHCVLQYLIYDLSL